MSEQFDPDKITRMLYGCSSWEDVWTPQLNPKDGWGTAEEAYEDSMVSTKDYDKLLKLYQGFREPTTIFLVGQYDDIDGVFLTREKAIEFAEKKYAHMPHHPPESFISEHKVDQG